MPQDFTRFADASQHFFELGRATRCHRINAGKETMKVPQGSQRHILTLALAALTLYRADKEKLTVFEKEVAMDPPVSGDALEIVASQITNYLTDGQSKFSQADYERFGHVCGEAGIIYQSGRLPEFLTKR